MQALINGIGWSEQFHASHPCATYTYTIGENLAVSDFVKNHHGKYIVGFLSYDLGLELQGITSRHSRQHDMPDAYFAAFDSVAALPQCQQPPAALPQFTASHSQSDYHAAFAAIRRHIYDGDIYQINLTHQLQATTQLSSDELFAYILPSTLPDMSALFQTPDFSLLSFSPEKFISIRGGVIATKPIKGTRRAGEEAALLASTKEQSELNMITDLLRNDLGKVCKAGSVRVQAHHALMRLPTISHTYSHITGSLRDDIAPIDALLSMFPGGSITGCPKKRAMEIIDEVEQTRRGAYCGSLVAIDPSGNLESSILIRTIVQQHSQLTLGVGGGIVYDSVETDEYTESLDKATSVIQHPIF